MNGINMLETIEVTVAPYAMASLLTFLIIMLIFGGIVGARIGSNKKISNKEYIIGVMFMIVILVISVSVAMYRVPTGVTQYKCTIENTVTFGEISEQYTILDVTVDESGDNIFLLEGK